MEEINTEVANDITEEKPKKTRKKKGELTTGGCCGQFSNKFQLRDPDGLINGIIYPRDKYGFVDWKALIPDEYIVLNKKIYEEEGILLDRLSEEQINKIKEGAPESRKLIKLMGFKDICKLRGIKSQKFEVIHRTPEMAVVSCTIQFIPNYENPNGLEATSIAQASLENTKHPYNQSLDVIASNKSFVRAVRDGLNIPIVAQDEILEEKAENPGIKQGSPLFVLLQKANEKNLKFPDLLELLKTKGIEIKEDWVAEASFPTPIIMSLIAAIKEI